MGKRKKLYGLGVQIHVVILSNENKAESDQLNWVMVVLGNTIIILDICLFVCYPLIPSLAKVFSHDKV